MVRTHSSTGSADALAVRSQANLLLLLVVAQKDFASLQQVQRSAAGTAEKYQGGTPSCCK